MFSATRCGCDVFPYILIIGGKKLWSDWEEMFRVTKFCPFRTQWNS